MFRFRSIQALVFVALCSSLVLATSLARSARGAPDDVVDLNGDTHHNPPASTTDKSTPQPAAPTDSGKPVDKGVKDGRDAAKQEAAEEKLKLRAGERVGNNASGAAQVLGMSLQEGTHNRVKVVDVAMNSPAFDAGVMNGDEILAFQGFRGESYRKWIDGIQRLTSPEAKGKGVVRRRRDLCYAALSPPRSGPHSTRHTPDRPQPMRSPGSRGSRRPS